MWKQIWSKSQQVETDTIVTISKLLNIKIINHKNKNIKFKKNSKSDVIKETQTFI